LEEQKESHLLKTSLLQFYQRAFHRNGPIKMKQFFTLLSVDGSAVDQALLRDAVIRTETPFHIQPFFSPQPVIAYLCGEPPFDNRKIYPFPALILCDDRLKSSNGSEVSGEAPDLVARIRTISSCARLPIIMLCKSAGCDSVSQCYEAGAGHFLHKPTSPGSLGLLVQSLYACANSAPLVSAPSA
jgi:CheY-like chemotaxis protein